MPPARILVFAGSTRTGSYNARLAAAAASELRARDAEVTLLSLADYPLPVYNADLEREHGVPEAAMNLRREFGKHSGIFIAAPEYNAGYTPLLKNSIDWVSRAREGSEPVGAAFRSAAFALGSASNGAFGGVRGMIALRQVLELGLGALVIPQVVTVPGAAEAFDEAGGLKAERPAQALRTAAERLISMAAHFAAEASQR